jgi:hypothetical protein
MFDSESASSEGLQVAEIDVAVIMVSAMESDRLSLYGAHRPKDALAPYDDALSAMDLSMVKSSPSSAMPTQLTLSRRPNFDAMSPRRPAKSPRSEGLPSEKNSSESEHDPSWLRIRRLSATASAGR